MAQRQSSGIVGLYWIGQGGPKLLGFYTSAESCFCWSPALRKLPDMRCTYALPYFGA